MASHRFSPDSLRTSSSERFEGDLGGGQAVMAKEALRCRQGEAFLDGGNGEGVAEHMRGNAVADLITVGYGGDEALDGAGGDAEAVVDRKVKVVPLYSYVVKYGGLRKGGAISKIYR
jgi:hypothetical protein